LTRIRILLKGTEKETFISCLREDPNTKAAIMKFGFYLVKARGGHYLLKALRLCDCTKPGFGKPATRHAATESFRSGICDPGLRSPGTIASPQVVQVLEGIWDEIEPYVLHKNELQRAIDLLCEVLDVDKALKPKSCRGACGRAASGQEAGGRAASGQEAGGRAASGQEAGGRAASGQEAGAQAASGQEAGAQAASGQEAGGRAASGQEAGAQAANGRPSNFWSNLEETQAWLNAVGRKRAFRKLNKLRKKFVDVQRKKDNNLRNNFLQYAASLRKDESIEVLFLPKLDLHNIKITRTDNKRVRQLAHHLGVGVLHEMISRAFARSGKKVVRSGEWATTLASVYPVTDSDDDCVYYTVNRIEASHEQTSETGLSASRDENSAGGAALSSFATPRERRAQMKKHRPN
jgi:hypothetical protein